MIPVFLIFCIALARAIQLSKKEEEEEEEERGIC